MLEAHVLASGSDGNCTVIESDGEAIMIDAGLSCKKILSLMELAGVDKSMIKAILVTHEHHDHISGVGATARKLKVPVYTMPATYNAVNMGSVDFRPVSKSSTFTIGHFNITPLPTSHDAADPCCYYTETDQGNVLLATDTGKLNFQIEHALTQADIAILESNYDPQMLADGPYPVSLKKRIRSEIGHLSNFDCAAAVKRDLKPTAELFLGHLSKTNNTPDTARQTVSDNSGRNRNKVDCMEFPGDVRTIKARV